MNEEQDLNEIIGTEKEETQKPNKGKGRRPTVVDFEESPDEVVEEDENSLNMNKESSRWAVSNNKFYGVSSSRQSLPPGVYTCRMNDTIGPFLQKEQNKTDELIHLPDNPSQDVLEEIENFSELREEFDKRGFLFKRGIFLYGPPASGKSTTIQLLIKLVIEKMDGIALLIQNPGIASECMNLLRHIEPDRQIIAIMEDLDGLVETYGESEYLSLLDGENQVDNIIFVVTTNYPEKLDKRFIDRPSRLDTRKYIGMPSYEARKEYFRKKEPSLSKEELEKYSKATEGYSVAYLKELIVLTKCFGKPFDEAVNRLRSMNKETPSSEGSKASGVGFLNEID